MAAVAGSLVVLLLSEAEATGDAEEVNEGRRGVPLLSRIPFLGLLFSRSEWNYKSTETIVIVRATVQDSDRHDEAAQKPLERFDRYEPVLDQHRDVVEDDLDQLWRRSTVPTSPASPEAPSAD